MEPEIDQSPEVEQAPEQEQQPVIEDKGGQESQSVPMERFNQVYANQKDLERRLNEQIEKNNLILAEIASRSAPKPEPEPDPLQDMDPDEAMRLSTIVTRAVERATAPLKQEITTLRGHTARRVEQEQFEQIKQVVGDDKIANRANQLLQQWEQRGLKGWSMKDAIIQAAGEAVVGEKLSKAQPRSERSEFNRMGAPVASQPGGQGGPRRKTQKSEDEMTPDELVAFYEDKLGDSPL